MKLKAIIAVIVAVVVGCLGTWAQSKPAIEFERKVVNFGKFTQKSPVLKTVFNFTNTGNAPLIIMKVEASCGCTTTNFTPYPVKPGQKGKVEVYYDGADRSFGPFQKTVRVYTNASSDPVHLLIKGDMQY